MENVNKLFDFNNEWALNVAVSAAENSPCRSKRGVVIFHRLYGLVSTGWNMPPKPYICDGSDECKSRCSKTAVHAEQMALLNFDKRLHIPKEECEMLHVKIVDGKAVHSEKPSCWQCSKLILQFGLKSMWLYQKEGFVEYSAEDFHEKTLMNCELK